MNGFGKHESRRDIIMNLSLKVYKVFAKTGNQVLFRKNVL